MDFNEVIPEMQKQIDKLAKRVKALEDAADSKSGSKK